MNRIYEERSMNAWPSLKTYHYDGWVLRYANRYTRRANAIYPLYESTLPMADKLAFCEAYYGDLNMPTTFKIHDSEDLHKLDIYLEDNGYHVDSPTDMMSMSLEGKDFHVSGDYRLARGYSQEWVDWYTDAVSDQPGSEQDILIKETVKQMMQAISPEALYVLVEEEGQVVAVGNGVLEDGALGIYNVVVDKDQRGRGYGKGLMNILLKEGQKLGATSSYLQVICNNEKAVNLYESMGYEKLYRYWYRTKNTL